MVERTLLAFGACFVGGIILYPTVITLLSKLRAGQRVQWTPDSHLVKAGTPTMGGIFFVLISVVGFSVFDRSNSGFLVAFALLSGAAAGFLDDLANIRGEGALGLLAKHKLFLQALTGLMIGIALYNLDITAQIIPWVGQVKLGVWIIPLTMMAILAASNAVNLTDGVDGLAASLAGIAFATTWLLGLSIQDRQPAILSAALCGALLAFLVYNWNPARLFMGDSGALALGNALVAVTAELHLLWLLPILGIVFVGETMSVIVQIFSIKRFGRRIFKSSPVHHHFEMIGWGEKKIVRRFCELAAVGAIATVLIAHYSGLHA